MSVLLVVEQRMFADALASVLRHRGIEVLGIVAPGDDAVAAAQELAPDTVLVDITGRTGRGREVGRAVRKLVPGARVISLVPADDPGLVREVVALGFHGSITRDADADALVRAIEQPAGHVASAPRRRSPGWLDGHEEFLISQLTPREIEVIRLMAMAASSDDIGRRLSISVNTVRSHIQSIFTKLQVHSRLGAVAFAARHELLSSAVPMPSLADVGGRDATGSLSDSAG
jgi:DNA-binding NarL/FixJ family response regulator